MKKFGPSCLKGEVISFDGKLNIHLVSTFYVNMLSILLFGPSCLKGEIISFDRKLNIHLVSTFYVNMLSILLCITWLLGLLKHYNLS